MPPKNIFGARAFANPDLTSTVLIPCSDRTARPCASQRQHSRSRSPQRQVPPHPLSSVQLDLPDENWAPRRPPHALLSRAALLRAQ